MRARTLAPVAAVALAAVLLAAGCGGSGQPKASDVSAAELALMPVPPRELPETRSLEVSAADSGPVNDALAAQTTIDPNDTPRAVREQGRLGGYDVSWIDPGLGRLSSGAGVVEVDTSVALFRSPRAARSFDARQTKDFKRFHGQEVSAGVLLVSSSSFRAPRIGDGSDGLRAEFRIGSHPAYSTFVDFLVGPLLCEAAITRADRRDARRRTIEIARALERRVRRVLAGKVHGKPQRLPKPPVEPTPPPGVANLAPEVLQARDLPVGTLVREDLYVSSPATVGSFRRDFQLGAAQIGHSRLLTLESGVDVFRNASDALRALGSVAGAYASASGPQLLARIFDGVDGGVPLSNGEIVDAGRVAAGDDALMVQVEFDSPFGSVTGVIEVVRVGSEVGTILATGQTGKVTAKDLVPLAKRLAYRLGPGISE